MRVNLTALAKRPRGRRSVTLRDIAPPAMFATDLYRALYAPALGLIARYIPRIQAEYERSLSTLTTDTAEDIDAILSEMQQELLRLVLTLRPAMRDWALKIEAWSRGKWRGAVLSATGVDLATVLGPADVAETLEQVIAWNVSLVKDVGAQASQRIGNAVFSGLNQRQPARDVAKAIRETTGMARDRSTRIAADQINKVSAQLAAERRREAGLSVYEWVHSRKAHPRTEHAARDGAYYTDDPAMVGRVVDGKTVRAEVARGDRPGEPPYCGCRQRAVMVWDDED